MARSALKFATTNLPLPFALSGAIAETKRGEGIGVRGIVSGCSIGSKASLLLRYLIRSDCIFRKSKICLRNNHHNLTDQEVRSLAIYAGMSGGVQLTSDNLQEISSDRLRLWKFILEMDSSGCTFPFLGSSAVVYDRIQPNYPSNLIRHEARLLDPVIVQVRSKINSKSDVSAVFIFNTDEYSVQRSFPLELLGLKAPLWVFDWIHNQAWAHAVEHVSVALDAHDGVILLLSETSFVKKQ